MDWLGGGLFLERQLFRPSWDESVGACVEFLHLVVARVLQSLHTCRCNLVYYLLSLVEYTFGSRLGSSDLGSLNLVNRILLMVLVITLLMGRAGGTPVTVLLRIVFPISSRISTFNLTSYLLVRRWLHGWCQFKRWQLSSLAPTTTAGNIRKWRMVLKWRNRMTNIRLLGQRS